jgi:hypothetical protein
MISNLSYPGPVPQESIPKESVVIPLDKKHLYLGLEIRPKNVQENPEIVLEYKGAAVRKTCRLKKFLLRPLKLNGSEAIIVEEQKASEFLQIWNGPSTFLKIGTKDQVANLPTCEQNPEVQYGL